MFASLMKVLSSSVNETEFLSSILSFITASPFKTSASNPCTYALHSRRLRSSGLCLRLSSSLRRFHVRSPYFPK